MTLIKSLNTSGISLKDEGKNLIDAVWTNESGRPIFKVRSGIEKKTDVLNTINCHYCSVQFLIAQEPGYATNTVFW